MADADTRAAKRRRFTSPLVTITVGANAEVFTVHEADLAEHSPFFKAALDKKWREGQTREIALPDDEPDIVATYLDWLHSKDVPLYLDTPDNPDYILLFKLYTFGDKIKDDGFCDDVLGAVCRGLDRENSKGELMSPGPLAVIILYEGTPDCSPLRALIARNHAERVTTTWTERGQDYGVCPKEFHVELSWAFVELRGKPKVEDWYDRRDQFLKQKRKVSQEKQ